MICRLLLCLIAASTLRASAASAQTAVPPAARASLDSVIDWITANNLLAGISVAIVRNDQVVYRRDAGWADREAMRRVDSNTVFYIASTTKPFTALATTLLDRDRIIDLDATVASLLPGARFGNGVNPARVTVRQLLSHTHGISGNGPVAYRAAYSGEIDRAALLRALEGHSAIEGSSPNAFRYSNFGYNLLSLAIDSLARKPWQDVLAERVFRPLGMRLTSARVSEIPRNQLAMPHVLSGDGLARVPYAKADNNMQAAGGMVSTASDLARFVIAQLGRGSVGGRQVFPSDVIEETQRPVASFSETVLGIPRFAYALGWQYGLVDGDTLIHHMGGFPGFSSGVSFIPSQRMGFVSVANGGFGPSIETPLMMYAYALLSGKTQAAQRHRATLDSAIIIAPQIRTSIAADLARRAARPQTMALPLTAYAGRYVNPLWGTIDVSVRDGRIVARNGLLEATAEVFNGAQHQLRVELEPATGRVMSFEVASNRPAALEYNGIRYVRQ